MANLISGFCGAVGSGTTVFLNTQLGNQTATQQTITDANGNYSFTGLAAGTYYLTTPRKAGVQIQVIISGSDFTNVNFPA